MYIYIYIYINRVSAFLTYAIGDKCHFLFTRIWHHFVGLNAMAFLTILPTFYFYILD